MPLLGGLTDTDDQDRRKRRHTRQDELIKRYLGDEPDRHSEEKGRSCRGLQPLGMATAEFGAQPAVGALANQARHG
jgi:hypothetical protein